MVKRGALVDATLIAAAVKRPPYGSGGANPRDPDARVTMKRKRVHFGYKAHLAVDEGSGLVGQADMTSANVHDSCLEAWQRLLNSWSSSIRCGVERAHATMKQWYGVSRVRYRGLARNPCHLQFVVTAMNIKRAIALMAQN
jgi:transposase, IS5 family